MKASRLSALVGVYLSFSVCTQAQVPGASWQSILEPDGLPRLDPSVLAIGDPSTRVSGAPGSFTIVNSSCHASPPEQLRRRIVDIAVQEWAWFGFLVDDLHGTSPPTPGNTAIRRFFLPLNPDEVARVAATVSGYWAAIPNSQWIVERQNEAWKQPSGLASRWRDPWSAAFISWVMCESGISEQAQFQRAIAHHSYIDQAIRARDGRAPESLFVAYDPGETEIEPGDLICSGLRPVYRSLAQRRAQLGEGARTHCDIVIAVDVEKSRILTIGGNVRASVRMKIFPAAVQERPYLAPLPTNRYIFAHLKLKTASIAPDAWQQSPSLQGLSCEAMPEDGASIAAIPRLRNLLC